MTAAIPVSSSLALRPVRERRVVGTHAWNVEDLTPFLTSSGATPGRFHPDDGTPPPTNPLGDAIETFVRREDAERFVDEVRGDDPELASYLRIEERDLRAGGLNLKLPTPVRSPRSVTH